VAFSSSASAQEAPDLVWEVEGNAGSVTAVGFSPDGQQVASGAGAQDGTATVWDAADGTAVATFPEQANGVYTVDLSTAGMLAVGGLVLSQGYPVPGGVTDVWRLADETIVHSFAGGYAAFCGDGNCDASEDQCDCANDCGTPPDSESICDDDIDNDCDLNTDCEDGDCDADSVCFILCGQRGDPCVDGIDCCSGTCKNNGTCR
jgi:WD40 repeat protein